MTPGGGTRPSLASGKAGDEELPLKATCPHVANDVLRRVGAPGLQHGG